MNWWSVYEVWSEKSVFVGDYKAGGAGSICGVWTEKGVFGGDYKAGVWEASAEFG